MSRQWFVLVLVASLLTGGWLGSGGAVATAANEAAEFGNSPELTLSSSDHWIPCLPAAAQISLVAEPELGLMHVDLTFPDDGYRIAGPGQVAVAAGVKPDQTTYLSNITTGVRIERYASKISNLVTKLRITYSIHYGDTTYFAFRVFYNGTEVKLKECTRIKAGRTILVPAPNRVEAASDAGR